MPRAFPGLYCAFTAARPFWRVFVFGGNVTKEIHNRQCTLAYNAGVRGEPFPAALVGSPWGPALRREHACGHTAAKRGQGPVKVLV